MHLKRTQGENEREEKRKCGTVRIFMAWMAIYDDATDNTQTTLGQCASPRVIRIVVSKL